MVSTSWSLVYLAWIFGRGLAARRWDIESIMDPDLSNEEWSMNDYYKKDDEKAPLNIWWEEIYGMNELAVESLSDHWLGDENNGDTRKLAESFLGIQIPNGGASLPEEQDPKFADDLKRLRQARGNDGESMFALLRKLTSMQIGMLSLMATWVVRLRIHTERES